MTSNQWGIQFLYWFTIFGAGFWGFVDLFRIPGVVDKLNKDIALEILQHIKIHAESGPSFVMTGVPAAPVQPAALTQAAVQNLGTPYSPADSPSAPIHSFSTAPAFSPSAPARPLSPLLSPGLSSIGHSQPIWLLPVGIAVALLVLIGVGSVGLRFWQSSHQPTLQAINGTTPAVQTITGSSPVTSSQLPNPAPQPETRIAYSAPAAAPALTLVRPLADPVASGMPRLYDFATTMNGGDGKACALIDPGNPTKRCKVSVSSSGQYAWGSSWCAANALALNNFLNHATLRYELDGRPIAVSQFWEGQSSTCLKRRLIVQNIPGGEQHELKLTITLDQDLVDGGSRYPAGEYEMILETEAS